MSAIRRCLAMTLGAVALALLFVAIGVPGAVVWALAPVTVCLSMVVLMTREGDVDAGLRRFESSRSTDQ